MQKLCFTGAGGFFLKTLGCSPCFLLVFRLARKWIVAQLGNQNVTLSFTRIVVASDVMCKKLSLSRVGVQFEIDWWSSMFLLSF